jgi:hypothetical protein
MAVFSRDLLTCSYAIKGSPNQKLLLEDIYYAIESRVGNFYYVILGPLITLFSS